MESYQLLDIAKKVLGELGLYGFKDVELTYRQKVGKEWRANFTFTRRDTWSKSVGCFAVNAETGEITFSAIDRVWKL